MGQVSYVMYIHERFLVMFHRYLTIFDSDSHTYTTAIVMRLDMNNR